jgi:hypothetical protein
MSRAEAVAEKASDSFSAGEKAAVVCHFRAAVEKVENLFVTALVETGFISPVHRADRIRVFQDIRSIGAGLGKTGCGGCGYRAYGGPRLPNKGSAPVVRLRTLDGS